MSKYFFDTEFYEDGDRIHPISLALVCDDGRELYIELSFDAAIVSDWVRDNVVRHLEWSYDARLPRGAAAERVLEFIGDDPNPEFWAYFADYDWILMCQLFGTMMDLPPHFPKYCLDLKQYWHHLGRPSVKPPKPKNAHNALADARWNLEYYKRLKVID